MKQSLNNAAKATLMSVLENRFEKHASRHRGIKWAEVAKKLSSSPAACWSLSQMEETGGEPDVIGFDKKTGKYLFCDCAAESPKGRRSICYDRTAQDGRKENAPKMNAVQMADNMGISLLNEDEYRSLQELGEFDLKTSSWILTPPDVRKRGGALFCDRRYDKVFVYHNGAESYYAARGFRGMLRV